MRADEGGNFFGKADMYICVCKAVTDKQITAAVADGAKRVADLSRRTGLGTCCGKCVPAARQLIDQARPAPAATVQRWQPARNAGAKCA